MAAHKQHLEALLRLSPEEREAAANALWDSLDDDLSRLDDAESDDTQLVRKAWADPVVVSRFDQWVGDNNIPPSFEYGKGWWDYVELVRRFAVQLDTEDVFVIGHYVVETPPPCERLPMPAVAISKPGVTFALRFDFGSLSLRLGSREWAVSVRRRSQYCWSALRSH
jgi:hypothetical protein